MTKLPDNARLGLTLYFKSPSLGQIMFVDVDASPDDDGEVELLPEDIHERKSSPTSSDKTAWTRDGPSQRPRAAQQAQHPLPAPRRPAVYDTGCAS
jgi:hypothetical protein